MSEIVDPSSNKEENIDNDNNNVINQLVHKKQKFKSMRIDGEKKLNYSSAVITIKKIKFLKSRQVTKKALYNYINKNSTITFNKHKNTSNEKKLTDLTNTNSDQSSSNSKLEDSNVLPKSSYQLKENDSIKKHRHNKRPLFKLTSKNTHNTRNNTELKNFKNKRYVFKKLIDRNRIADNSSQIDDNLINENNNHELSSSNSSTTTSTISNNQDCLSSSYVPPNIQLCNNITNPQSSSNSFAQSTNLNNRIFNRKPAPANLHHNNSHSHNHHHQPPHYFHQHHHQNPINMHMPQHNTSEYPFISLQSSLLNRKFKKY